MMRVTMLILVSRRLTASALVVGRELMALSACAGGAMTMSEMVCCVDHHGDCPMAEMGESCCGSDQDAGFGMLKAERADDTLASTIHHLPVGVTLAALLPIMWSTGIGSDVMKPMAAPIIGGMVTSTVHVLIITPVIFFIMKRRALRRGKLRPSTMTSASS
ncbi:MAG TPA: hypothetical protein EYQ83_13370 [Acidobacteria bacterium]|nr:hypothetical protein [Acidobacteriota bacterium]